MAIYIEEKTEYEISIIRDAANIASEVLSVIREHVVPEVSAKYLDEIAGKIILKYKAEPIFYGYRNYPANICVSVNSELVHGIPTKEKILKEGDIVTVDLGVRYKELCADVAETLPVGKIVEKTWKLLDVTYSCFNAAIKNLNIENRVGDISWSIQSFVEENGYTVIRDYVGHGIGRELHEKPEIPNFGHRGTGPRLSKGLVLCIEPMVCEGSYKVKVLNDNWTVVMADGKLCAHYEHMFLITDNGPEILTHIYRPLRN